MLILFILLALSSSAFTQPDYKANWVLVYENDEQGNRVQGSKAELIKAIQQGEVVRISWCT